MIKTLRITGVAAVAFAGLVLASVFGLVSWIHLDGKNEERVSEVLLAPRAVERFHELHGDKNPSGQDTKPPLVKQAELFKDIIDPKIVTPTKVADAAPVAPRPGPAPKRVEPLSALFTLIGTSYSASNPSSSFAYIRLPDNTFQWVQCGDEVGRLIIKEVKESSLVYWDGQRENEIPMEPAPERVSLVATDEVSIGSSQTPASQPSQVKVAESPAAPPKLVPQPVPPAMRGGASKMTDDEQRAISELVEKYHKMQGSSGDANPATAADRLALANKLMSELRSSRVSPQETRRLGSMGDQASQNKDRAPEEPRSDKSPDPSNSSRD